MVVYVHDRVVFFGGGESMLQKLIRHFGVDEHTKLFVLYSTHDYFVVGGYRIPIVAALPRTINMLFAWGGRSYVGAIRWLFDYRNLMFFYPGLCRLLARKIRHMNPNHVVISSFATAKNVVPAQGWEIPTTLYLHSPMQYIRENYEEYMGKITGFKKQLFRFAVSYLRPRDKKNRSYDKVYANSNYTASCAKKYYSFESIVRYPPLDDLFFSMPAIIFPRDYFVYIGRLVRFIREVDRVIMLCNDLKIPLIIVGTGPDEAYLKLIAGPTITFVGQVSDVGEKIEILKHARGLINLAKESCGIATMEALSLGVPVFGYAQGGSRELVTPDISNEGEEDVFVSSQGVLVSGKSPDLLSKGIGVFLKTDRDRVAIQKKAHVRLYPIVGSIR